MRRKKCSPQLTGTSLLKTVNGVLSNSQSTERVPVAINSSNFSNWNMKILMMLTGESNLKVERTLPISQENSSMNLMYMVAGHGCTM